MKMSVEVVVDVTASDGAGMSVTDMFKVTVSNTNDEPEVSAGIADQGATEDSAFTFVVPGDAFSDPDAGDSLTLSASGAGGTALPAGCRLMPRRGHSAVRR